MGDGTEVPRDLRPEIAGPGLIFLNLRGTGTTFSGTVQRGYGTGTENPASPGHQNPGGLGQSRIFLLIFIWKSTEVINI